MTDTTFRTAFRGYDPSDVDPALAQLRKAVQDSNAEVGRVNVELAQARTEADALRAAHASAGDRVRELERQIATVGRPTYAEFGETVGRILTLAEKEAAALKASAQAEADRLLGQARTGADALTQKAQREAAELASSSQAEATRLLTSAKREADEILDSADRESSARREEAEAVYEQQQQRATAAAADFERTLAGRRDASAKEFALQEAAHAQNLTTMIERREAAEAEGARVLAEAHEQARGALDAAHTEAAQVIAAARANADRIRRDSDRELVAATQRRDAITSQLTNVRQMLSTLGHDTSFGFTEARTVAEPAEPEGVAEWLETDAPEAEEIVETSVDEVVVDAVKVGAKR